MGSRPLERAKKAPTFLAIHHHLLAVAHGVFTEVCRATETFFVYLQCSEQQSCTVAYRPKRCRRCQRRKHNDKRDVNVLQRCVYGLVNIHPDCLSAHESLAAPADAIGEDDQCQTRVQRVSTLRVRSTLGKAPFRRAS